MSDAAHSDLSLETDLDGVELKSVIVPQDFLPGRSSDWARLRFAGLERGKELVVGKMVGIVNSAEERAPSIEGEWLSVSRVEDRAFRMRAGRRMVISPREVLRPSEAR